MPRKTAIRFRCGACHHVTEFNEADIQGGAEIKAPAVCPNCGKGGDSPLNKAGVWAAGRLWRGRANARDTTPEPPFYPYDFAN